MLSLSTQSKIRQKFIINFQVADLRRHAILEMAKNVLSYCSILYAIEIIQLQIGIFTLRHSIMLKLMLFVLNILSVEQKVCDKTNIIMEQETIRKKIAFAKLNSFIAKLLLYVSTIYLLFDNKKTRTMLCASLNMIQAH